MLAGGAVTGGAVLLLTRAGGSGDQASTTIPAPAPPVTAPATTLARPAATATPAPTAVPTTTTPPVTTVRPTTTAPPATTATAAPETLPAVAPTTLPVVPPVVPPATVAPVTIPLADLAPRSAVYAGGKVYLRGAVPSQAVADELVAKTALVVGQQNVVVEYVVDPRAPLPDSAPLKVADSVLFESGSAVFAPAFHGLVDLGIVLLAQNPAVTIVARGFTDDRGDGEYNLRLSARRLQAIVHYVTSKGVDPARLRTEPYGEAFPIASNATPEGRAANRRIEFEIIGLLD
jgi:outer membrane protein OmpA-like peptidoglycan-associated protein